MLMLQLKITFFLTYTIDTTVGIKLMTLTGQGGSGFFDSSGLDKSSIYNKLIKKLFIL